MKTMQRFALIGLFYLVFNMVAMPLWWGGVSATEGFREAIQLTVLAGFIYIALFDLISTGWIMTRVCWVREGGREEGCQKGWLLVLAAVALVALMGAKVMVDEIARETAMGGGGGEWVILYICLALQFAYLVALIAQGRGSPGPLVARQER